MRFSTKSIIKLTIPIILENLLIVTVGMFDGIMVASSGETAVSGVSLGDSINVFLTMFFAALSSGGAIVISQLFGKKDILGARETAKQLFFVTLAISTLLCLIISFLHTQILNLIYGSVELGVMENAKVYFFVTGLSYPFWGVISAGNSILRAQGKTKTTLLISILGNLINVAGNALLIYGFNMGVLGAAVATLFSRIVAAIFSTILVVIKTDTGIYIENLFKYKPSGAIIKNICNIGIPSGLENSFFQLGRLIVSSLISTFGTASIAANSVASTISNFHFSTGNAFGMAMSTIIGILIGAGEQEEAKKNVKKIVGYNYICFVFVSIIFSSAVGLIAKIYNLSPDAEYICTRLVWINCVSACLVWPLSFTLPNAFRAASDIKFTMVISIVSMWIFRVGGSYFLAYVFNQGVYSVWLAMSLDWCFRTAVFLIRFIKGTWLTKYKPA